MDPADPGSAFRLLKVTVRLAPHAKYSSDDFTLTYPQAEKQATLYSYALVHGGEYFELHAGLSRKDVEIETFTKRTNIDVFFIVWINSTQPLETTEVTLRYKDQPAGKPLSIKQ
jgi:hypothetical protein